MDPDLVRQQAEEEAASRMLSRRAMPPDMRVEPVLPMARPRETLGRPSLPVSLQHGNTEAAATVVAAGWRTALAISASCVLGVTVGLVGGLMLGVKLHLVPAQSAMIAGSAGAVMGWQLASGGLIRRGAVSRWRAYGAGFRTSLLVLAVMSGAMFVAPHYLGSAATPRAPFEIGVFWRSVAAGAMVALVLGGVVLRSAMNHGKAARA
jgi:hypothetical protein